MSLLRKLKKKQAGVKQSKKKAEKDKKLQQHVTQQMIMAGARALKKMKDARVAVLLVYYIYVMYYELKAPLDLLYKLPQFIDDVQWYLQYSYNAKGQLQKKPSFTLLEACQQIHQEKGYWVDVRTSYDPKDDLLCEIVRTEITLECQLMWITADSFPRFGKVKLGKLQQRIHELENTLTYAEYIEMRNRITKELLFTFDDCAEIDFCPWLWDESRRAA